MSEGNVFNRMITLQETFSSGQRDIARFIMSQYQAAAFMSAAEVGEHVGVSESTVIRFALHLGYEGYPELKRSIQSIVKSQLTTVNRVRNVEDQAKDDLPFRIIEADLNNLAALRNSLDVDSFRRAVTTLVEAENVYIVAARSALSVASFLSYNLGWIRPRVHLITPGFVGDMVEQLIDASANDVVLAITIPRYTRVTVDTFLYAKSRPCTTIALTDTALSPLARDADIVLGAGTHVESFADSFVAPLSLVNALLGAVSSEALSRTTNRLEDLEQLWKQTNVYVEE